MSQQAQTETTSLYESEPKIYPRMARGRYARLRVLAMVVLLGLYYLLPWITIGGEPIVHFDLPARRFHVFGLTLVPQDLFLLSWLLILAALTLFLFTTLGGRLWCGYACPQTVWTESFLWIERWIEGERHQRIKMGGDFVDRFVCRAKVEAAGQPVMDLRHAGRAAIGQLIKNFGDRADHHMGLLRPWMVEEDDVVERAGGHRIRPVPPIEFRRCHSLLPHKQRPAPALLHMVPPHARHAELVSASISRPKQLLDLVKWTLKQVQGDDEGDVGLTYIRPALTQRGSQVPNAASGARRSR